MQVGFPQKSHFGVLTATEVRTPIVNNPAGDLAFQRAGVLRAALGAGSFSIYTRPLKLLAGVNIEDTTGVLLGSDDLGHIDQLGRVDAQMTTKDGAHVLGVSPASGLISGGAVQSLTFVRATAGGNVIIAIDRGVPANLVNQAVKVQSVEIHYYTSVAGAYIDSTKGHTNLAGLEFENITNNDDRGNGSTGASDYTVTPAAEFAPAGLTMVFAVVIPSGYVEIRSIKVTLASK